MKDRFAEMILMVVVIYLLVTSIFFWYDRATNQYIRSGEKWKADVTAIINYNIQTGKIVKPGVPEPPRK